MVPWIIRDGIGRADVIPGDLLGDFSPAPYASRRLIAGVQSYEHDHDRP